MAEESFNRQIIPEEQLEFWLEKTRNAAAHWHVLGFRLLPAAFWLWFSVAAEVWPSTFGEEAAGRVWQGAFLLTLVATVWLGLKLGDYVPRYGQAAPLRAGFWKDIRSLPVFLLMYVGCPSVPVAAFLIDWKHGWPISITLISLGIFPLAWWLWSGTKGRLFSDRVEWCWATIGIPLRSKVWDLCCRHYWLISSGVIFILALSPLSGLVSSRTFLDLVFLQLLMAIVLTICIVFDDLRLKRLPYVVNREE